MTLASFGTSRHDVRRGIEWKLSFGLWALMAAATLRGFEALPAITVLVPIAHAWWLRNIWKRHSADNELAWNFVNEAQRLIGTYGIKTIGPKPELRIGRGRAQKGSWAWYGFLGDWGLMFQLLVTIVLAAAAYATASRITLFELILRPGAN